MFRGLLYTNTLFYYLLTTQAQRAEWILVSDERRRHSGKYFMPKRGSLTKKSLDKRVNYYDNKLQAR